MNFGLMQTGRPFTDYSTASIMNKDIKKDHDVPTNNDYRQFLQRNAINIMTDNKSNAYMATPYNNMKTLKINIPPKSNHIFTNIHDKTKTTGYEPSDLKDSFITRKQLEQRKHTPLVDQEKLLYYHK